MPTFRLLAMPTPPATVSAPVVDVVDSVAPRTVRSLKNSVAPVTAIVPSIDAAAPTLRFLEIPTLPATRSVPESTESDWVTFVTERMPVFVVAPLIASAPLTQALVSTVRLLAMPTPPLVTIDPDEVDVELVVLLTLTVGVKVSDDEFSCISWLTFEVDVELWNHL